MFSKLVLITVSTSCLMGHLKASAYPFDAAPIKDSAAQSSGRASNVEETVEDEKNDVYISCPAKYEGIEDWKLAERLQALLETKKKGDLKSDSEVQVLANYLLKKFSGSESWVDPRHYKHIFTALLGVYPKDNKKIFIIADRMVKIALRLRSGSEQDIEWYIRDVLGVYDNKHPNVINMADHLAKVAFECEFADSKVHALRGLLRLRLYDPLRHDYLANQLATYDFMAVHDFWGNQLLHLDDSVGLLVFIYGKKDERVLRLANLLADQASTLESRIGYVGALLESRIGHVGALDMLLKVFNKEDARIQAIAKKLSNQSFKSIYSAAEVLKPLVAALGTQNENVQRIALACLDLFSLTKDRKLSSLVPAFRPLAQIFGISDPRIQNLVNDLRTLAKKEDYQYTLLQLISDFSSVLGSTHPYVQELINYQIQRDRAADPNSPFWIHKQLLQKESVTVFPNIIDAVESDITFRINPDWMKKSQQYIHIPFEYETFQTMVGNLKNKIATKSAALKTFEETLSGVDLEEYKVDEDFYSGLLDHTSLSTTSSASSSSSSSDSVMAVPVKASTMESYRLRFVLKNIQDKYNTPGSAEDLNEGDRALIQLLMNVHTCPTGQSRGVHMTFYNLGFDRLYSEKETDNKVILDKLYEYIDAELRRQCELSLNRLDIPGVNLNVHDTQYLTTLLGRSLGFFIEGETPPFDINGSSISRQVRSLTKQEALDKFFQVVTTGKIIEWTQGFFSEIDQKITIGTNRWEKFLVVSATLSDVQSDDAHKNIPLNPKYITFNDPETMMDPNGITPIAAGEMLVRFGILTGIGA